MARYKRLGKCMLVLSALSLSFSITNKILIIDVVQRYQNGKDMYDALTRHYARTFRGTLSPFDKEWNSVSHKNTFDNDADLISKFENLKIAEKYHCRCLQVLVLSNNG